MLATLDPLGLPLATLTVAGNEAEDGLYLPTIERARAVVGCGGRLYVGDALWSCQRNRATIDRDGDYYPRTQRTVDNRLPRRQALPL